MTIKIRIAKKSYEISLFHTNFSNDSENRTLVCVGEPVCMALPLKKYLKHFAERKYDIDYVFHFPFGLLTFYVLSIYCININVYPIDKNFFLLKRYETDFSEHNSFPRKIIIRKFPVLKRDSFLLIKNLSSPEEVFDVAEQIRGKFADSILKGENYICFIGLDMRKYLKDSEKLKVKLIMLSKK